MSARLSTINPMWVDLDVWSIPRLVRERLLYFLIPSLLPKSLGFLPDAVRKRLPESSHHGLPLFTDPYANMGSQQRVCQIAPWSNTVLFWQEGEEADAQAR